MKKIRLFNTLQNKKQIFTPDKETVGMYVCGITPDGSAHLGHAFLFTSFDVFVRYLKFKGYKTKYVQNLTDIDDDILVRSKKAGKHWREFGEENAQIFLDDMKWLNNQQPDYYPKATDHIDEMIMIIKQLLGKNMAYEKNGSVYFSVNKDKKYGKLSRLDKKEMLAIANERGNNPNDPNKKDSLDFLLWQAAKKGEPQWDSPWGKGRPGWHIECSAMATKYLEASIDVQSGGTDLIFPHHESSIAQSEYASGKPFAKFWMHVGMLEYKGE
ncbi:MAG: class I tRNA ligase family protein, partial [archaeon]|nr:class I tRNA ligase family protein [archaeon]